jgi:energy-converting hydrogenase Eha subunit B
MNMINWRTTVAGLIGAIAMNAVAYFQNNQTIDWKVFTIGVVMAALGFVCKDANVTGGTIPQPSNEAAKLSVLAPTSKEEGVQK